MKTENAILEIKTCSEKIPLTAIVVTYNEEHRLRQCLESLSRCEQLVVVDLHSADKSVRIARECGAEVYQHAWVPFAEQVLPYATSFARNEWILRLDPDEVFPAEIITDLLPLLVQSQTAAMIGLPNQYFFLGKPLRTTIWGGRRIIPRIFHKDRIEIRPYVHRAFRCKAGHPQITLESGTDCVVRHYWADSFHQLFEKHNRYLRYEGESKYGTGERFSWHKMIRNTVWELGINLIYYRGLLGGLHGIFLSFYRSWYVLMGWLSLRDYERNL